MSQTVQIIFKESDWGKLTRYLSRNPDLESGAYAIFKTSTNPGTVRFLVNRIVIPGDCDYHKRSGATVAFTAGFTEVAFQACEKINGHLLDIHTHPWSEQVQFSGIDDHEAKRTKAPYMAKYLPGMMIAFIVFGMSTSIVRARFWDNGRSCLQSISRIIVL